MLARDLMTRNPLCCTESCTAQTAAGMMQEAASGFIPVLKKFTRKVLGVVTDRDLCLGIIAQGKDPKRTLVSECMNANPVCCHSDDEVSKIVALMKQHQIRRILVLNKHDDLVGVVSLSDLLRFDTEHASEVYQVFKRICEPTTTCACFGI